MTDSDFIVILIMSWCDFHSSSPEGHVDSFTIGDNWQPTVDKRVKSIFPVKVLKRNKYESNFERDMILFKSTLYRVSSGCTAMAVSPSIVSGRVVAIIIFSSDHTLRKILDAEICPHLSLLLGMRKT